MYMCPPTMDGREEDEEDTEEIMEPIWNLNIAEFKRVHSCLGLRSRRDSEIGLWACALKVTFGIG